MRNFDDLVAAGVDVRLDPGALTGWVEGDAGWAVGHPAFVLPGGARIPTRLTAVLVRRGGGWRVAHAHFSVSVPDDVAVREAFSWLEALGA